MLYDVKVLNGHGVWVTDLTTGSHTRAQERAKYLTPRTAAVVVEDSAGRRRMLEGV